MKVYVVNNSSNGEVNACGSIKAVSDITGIYYGTLLYQFSRCGRVSYDSGLYRINLVTLTTSKR